jgi:hypothetical protein
LMVQDDSPPPRGLNKETYALSPMKTGRLRLLLFLLALASFSYVVIDYLTIRDVLSGILALILMAAFSSSVFLFFPRQSRPEREEEGQAGSYYDAEGRLYVPCFVEFAVNGAKRTCVLKDGHRGPHSDRLPSGYRKE